MVRNISGNAEYIYKQSPVSRHTPFSSGLTNLIKALKVASNINRNTLYMRVHKESGFNIFYILIFLVLFASCTNNTNNNSKIISEIDNNQESYISHKDSLKIIKILGNLKTAYTENAEDLSELINNVEEDLEEIVPTSQLPEYYNKIGLIFFDKSNYIYAEEFFNKAYLIYKNDNKEIQAAQQLSNISVIKELSGKYDEAIDNCIKALEIFIENKDYISAAYTYNNIGVVYEQTHNTQKAVEYYKLALEIEEQDDSGASILTNIGVAYESNNDIDSALHYYKEALKAYETIDEEINTATVINNIGHIYLLKNNNDSAIQYFDKAMPIFKKNKNINGEVQTLKNMGEYYFRKKEYKKSKQILLKSMGLAENIQFPKTLSQISDLLSQVYEAVGNYKEANIYLKYHYTLKDSIFKAENIKQINTLEIKYKLREKEGNIKILNEENNSKRQKLKARNRLIISLVLLVIVIIGIAYFFRQRARQKLNQMELDIQKYILKIKDLDSIEKLEYEITSKEFSIKYELTERETEVLHLISEGMSNADIGKKIFVSTNTVKYHIKNIYLKLDVKNRVEALNKIKQ